VNQKYMKMTKDDIFEGSFQQANKEFINRRKGQDPNHLKFFLLVFSKDEAQVQLIFLFVKNSCIKFVDNIGVALGKIQRGKPKDNSHVRLLDATLEKELEE